MQNNLTLDEVVERIKKEQALLKQTRMLDSPKLRTEYQQHRSEFYVPKLTLRKRLDAGDQTLRSLMTELEQVVNYHLGESGLDRKKPERVKVEPTGANNESTGTGRPFP
jgi:hypothetical protein